VRLTQEKRKKLLNFVVMVITWLSSISPKNAVGISFGEFMEQIVQMEKEKTEKNLLRSKYAESKERCRPFRILMDSLEPWHLLKKVYQYFYQ
jgi:hypothetical protein